MSRFKPIECKCKKCQEPFIRINPRQRYCSLYCSVWDKISIRTPEECWPWMDHANIQGYGQITFDKKGYVATRLIYEFVNGAFPKELCVCHSCDNPSCCNPSHLFLGTYFDNTRDCVKKDRMGKKLTIDIVKQIRKELSEKVVFQSQLADKYRVSRATICRIKSKERWGLV